jgi:hypothetical protein
MCPRSSGLVIISRRMTLTGHAAGTEMMINTYIIWPENPNGNDCLRNMGKGKVAPMVNKLSTMP